MSFAQGVSRDPAASPSVRASESPDRPTLEIRDLRFRYTEDGPLILDLDLLRICPGERVALVGENGCGKTTLLRVLNGSLEPEQGRIELGGRIMSLRQYRQRVVRRQIGFIFQGLHLVERSTAFDNVLWGRLGYAHPLGSLLGVFVAGDRERARLALDEVGLGKLANRRVDTLSGGQKQRVAIARVLAQEAELILADEPVSSLDPAAAEETLQLLSELCRSHRRALVISLHRPDFALRYSDRVLALHQGTRLFDRRIEDLQLAELEAIYDSPRRSERA